MLVSQATLKLVACALGIHYRPTRSFRIWIPGQHRSGPTEKSRDPKHQNLKGRGPGHENEPQMGPMGTSMCPGDFSLKQLRDFSYDDDFFFSILQTFFLNHHNSGCQKNISHQPTTLHRMIPSIESSIAKTKWLGSSHVPFSETCRHNQSSDDHLNHLYILHHT